MRNILIGVACVCFGTVGCALPGDKAQVGWHFEILKPPTINTETPILVQSTGASMGAHPLGSLAGPVTEGTMRHGPSTNTLIAPQLIQPAPRSGLNGIAGDCGQPRGLSIEEWCRIMNEMKGRPMPSASAQ